MSTKSTSERLSEAMSRSRHLWRSQKAEAVAAAPPAPAPPAFTIALSREAGANGSGVARALGERLGWPVYDRELLQRVAEDMGLGAGLLEGVDERRRGWLQECLEALIAGRSASQGAYVRHLVGTLLALAAHGQCVLVGRGAAQILPAATTLRVRLVAPLEDRVAVTQQRFGSTRDGARRWVEETDRERSGFVHDVFHKDPADPRLYDLVINAARFPAPECAELIIDALHRLQGRASVLGPDSVAP